MSAVFAALTAIFAKIGIENVNSDFATFHPHHRDSRLPRDLPDRHRPIPVCPMPAGQTPVEAAG
jgi:hypothetical protein